MEIRRLPALASVLQLVAISYAIAQQQTPAPYVLHAYANLVQVPALMLDHNFQTLQPQLSKDQIDIRLDSGPVFHPTQMHIEGTEPIALGILLDASGNQERLLRGFAPALDALAQGALLPHDTVSVFAVDCKIVRSALNLPVAPTQLADAVERALAAPSLHREDGKTCSHDLRLWDAAAQAVESLARQPGRRVLLLVSAGQNRRSAVTTTQLRGRAGETSVALFGLRDFFRFAGDYGYHGYGVSGVLFPPSGSEDPYTELTEFTGGLIYTTMFSELRDSLLRLVAMVRGRYILEFPRSDERDPGRHSIDVTVRSTNAFIATAGVTVPLADAAIAADPTTVPSSPSPAVLGKRRPIDHN